MPSFRATRIETTEWLPRLQYDLPLAIDDMSLAHHLGIRNRVLWWMIHDNKKLYDCFKMPKRGKNKKGQFRDIQNPSAALKNIQRIILAKFLEPIPLGTHVGAYVHGRSCRDTAQQHVSKAIIISLDLKDFFTSVKRSMVRRVLHDIGYNHEVSSLLAQLMCFNGFDIKQQRDISFVPQGSPTSGFIANLVADRRFDREILSMLQRADPTWVYTRYSDDIDISHPNEQSAETVSRIVNDVADIIRSSGFRLNTTKTKLEPKYWRQRVLGMVVNEKISIPRLEYMRIRSLIHNCYVHGFESQFERAGARSAEALKAHIRGKLNFFEQVDDTKAQQLHRKFDKACDIHDAPDIERVTF